MTLPKPYYHDERAGITIYNADCRDVLPHLPQFDLVLTDPPYGIGFQSARPTESRKKEKIKGDGLDEYLELIKWLFPAIKNILNDGGIVCCCCCGGGGTPSLAYAWIEIKEHLNLENVLIWDKGFVGMGWRYRFQWEAVLIASKGERKTWNGGNNRSNIIEFQKVIPQAGDHPTPKPESLMRQLILDNSNAKEFVLDPFMGSGTTLRAAKDLGRKAVGVEISERYCEIAARRLQQEVLPFVEENK